MKTQWAWKLLVAFSCLIWAWGCMGNLQPGNSPLPVPTSTQAITAPPGSQAPAIPPSMESNIATQPILATLADPEPPESQLSAKALSCQADLAHRLGKPETAIQFWREFSDEFPADHLGCIGPQTTPRPIPAIVSGTVIQFKAEGTIYSYHIHGGQVEFCGPWE